MRRVQPFVKRGGLLCLLLLAMGSGAQQFKGVGDPTRPPPGAMRAQTGATGANDTVQAAASAASSADVPEPVSPAESAARVAASLTLNAIRFDEHAVQGMALINGDMYNVGDAVGPFRVAAITRELVVLTGPGGERRLTLLPEPKQTKSSSPSAHKRRRKEHP
jgi:hypothetical protein